MEPACRLIRNAGASRASSRLRGDGRSSAISWIRRSPMLGAKYLGLSPELARPPGFIVATIVNFLLNRAITFRHSRRAAPARFRPLLAASPSAGLSVNYAVYSACVLARAAFRDRRHAGDPAAVRRRRGRRGDGRHLPRLPALRFSLVRTKPLPKSARHAMMRRNRTEEPRMSQSPYERDLDRNPANFQPLTPLAFLERAAEVFPDRLGDRPRKPPPQLSRVSRPVEEARLGARQARLRARRHDRGHARQHPGDARMPLRRADVRRGAQCAQHPARRGGARLHARSRRSEGADRRSRVLRRDRRRR